MTTADVALVRRIAALFMAWPCLGSRRIMAMLRMVPALEQAIVQMDQVTAGAFAVVSYDTVTNVPLTLGGRLVGATENIELTTTDSGRTYQGPNGVWSTVVLYVSPPGTGTALAVGVLVQEGTTYWDGGLVPPTNYVVNPVPIVPQTITSTMVPIVPQTITSTI